MTALLREERQFTIVDPMHYDAFETSRGVLQPSKNGYITTRNPDLAQEIQQREPWALVTEHAPLVGNQAVRGQSMITVPEMPWKKSTESTHRPPSGGVRNTEQGAEEDVQILIRQLLQTGCSQERAERLARDKYDATEGSSRT